MSDILICEFDSIINPHEKIQVRYQRLYGRKKWMFEIFVCSRETIEPKYEAENKLYFWVLDLKYFLTRLKYMQGVLQGDNDFSVNRSLIKMKPNKAEYGAVRGKYGFKRGRLLRRENCIKFREFRMLSWTNTLKRMQVALYSEGEHSARDFFVAINVNRRTSELSKRFYPTENGVVFNALDLKRLIKVLENLRDIGEAINRKEIVLIVSHGDRPGGQTPFYVFE